MAGRGIQYSIVSGGKGDSGRKLNETEYFLSSIYVTGLMRVSIHLAVSSLSRAHSLHQPKFLIA